MKSLQEAFGALLESIPEETRLANRLKGLISAKIVHSRLAKNLTQKELAESLGLKQPSLSKWENGDQNFTIEQICKICVMLDIDYRDIFQAPNFLDEEKTPDYYIPVIKSSKRTVDNKPSKKFDLLTLSKAS